MAVRNFFAMLCCGKLVLFAACRSTSAPGSLPDAFCYPEQILTMQRQREEIDQKTARITGFLRKEGLGGILLQRKANVAWITAGAACEEVIAGNENGTMVLIGEDTRKLFLYRTDLSAATVETLKSFGFELRQLAWNGDSSQEESWLLALKDLGHGGSIASDLAYPDLRLADEDLRNLQVPLTKSEVQKYRWLGRRSAEVVEALCRRIESGMTERGIEATLGAELLRQTIQPLELKVKADGKVISGNPEYSAATGKVEKRAEVRVKAGRWGMVVALSRTIHFGPLTRDLRLNMTTAARLNAGFWARTVPGATIGGILQGTRADYAEVGDPDGWRRESPGGILHYGAKESHLKQDLTAALQPDVALTWSSYSGDLRIEETILLAGDNLEVVTATNSWPMMESAALGRIYRIPAILVR